MLKGLAYAAEFMAKERADLVGYGIDYWLYTLEEWHKYLQDRRPGSSIGTAGFILTKDDEYTYTLVQQVISMYDLPEDEDNIPFYWIDREKNVL